MNKMKRLIEIHSKITKTPNIHITKRIEKNNRLIETIKQRACAKLGLIPMA